jgi:hypothetical protein
MSYTRSDGKSVGGAPYFQMAANLKNMIEKELDEAGKIGADEGQRFIREDAGTGNTWLYPWSDGRTGSYPGRVDSGDMASAMDHKIIQGENVDLDIGWVRIWEEYFGAQEEGFTNGGSRTSKVVAGMGVMAHLQTYIRSAVDGAIDRVIDGVVNGL